MEDVKAQICRSCLKVIPVNSFDSLTETHIIQLHYILPELNLSVSHDPVLCKSCIEIIQHSYDFKRSCAENELYLENFATATKQINLEEVVSNRTSDKEDGEKLKLEYEGRNRICRLCLGIIEGNSIRELGIIEENILQRCAPEMDLNLTKDPVSCDSCMELLHCQYNFIMKSRDVEERISNYIIIQHLSNGDLINLHDIVDIKLEKSYTENTYESNKMENEIDEDWKNVIISNETNEPVCEDTLIASSTEEINSTEDSKININENMEQSGMLHKCDLCPYSANLKFSLDIHMLIHGNSGDVTTYKCTECGYVTNQKNNLLLHNLKHKKPSQMKLYYCKQCDFKTKWRSNLFQHKRSHRPPDQIVMHKCADCSYQTIIKGNLTTHMTLHKNRDELVMHKCSECLYQTRLKYSLKKHLLTHKNKDELTRYKCTDCDYESKWKWHVKRHRVTQHSESVNLYKCAQCPYEGKHKFYLRRHMLIHNRNRDKTEECSKEKQLSHIESHEMAFKCDLCPYESKQRRYLQRHMKGHLDTLDIVKFKCEFCPFQTVNKHVLTTHGLIHQNYDELEKYKCDMCTYQTIRKGDLAKHFRKVHKSGVHPK